MITITLEGECWRDILREMSIIEASVRGSRIEDLTDEGIVAPDERSGQDGPKKPVCAYCGMDITAPTAIVGRNGNFFCCVRCVDRFDYIPAHQGKVYDIETLRHILEDYQLGPEERAEILGRVRQ